MNLPDTSEAAKRIHLFPSFLIVMLLFTVMCLSSQHLIAQGKTISDPFDTEAPLELAQVMQSIESDDYDQALKQLADLRTQALKSRNKALVKEIVARMKDVNQLKNEFAKVSDDVEALKKKTDNPEACKSVGNFYCAEKGSWGKGLQLLSKSDDPSLRETAAADLKRPASAPEQAQLAEAWWKLAAKEKGQIKEAYQLRGRYWYLLARPGLNQRERLSGDKQLQFIPLRADKIVIWNLHYGRASDRGTVSCLVTLLYQGKPVWRQVTQLPWSPEYSATQILRPDNVRFDQIRLDITKFRGKGGGFTEVEVFDGNINVASHCTAVANEYFEQNERYVPNNITDGIKQGPTGYWLLNNRKTGWILIDMVKYLQQP